MLVDTDRLPLRTLLGAERFKLINQAAKDALELGGFLGQTNNKKSK